MAITALEPTTRMPGRPLPRPLALVEPPPCRPWPPRFVRPLRPVPPVPAASAPTPAPRPVRITRRGRLAVTLTILAMLGAVAFTAARSSPGDPAPGRPPAGSVVVQPGDTLWGVAVRADPRADPRVTIERIVELNGMPDATVRPGQRLRLPRE
jgi:nucleoid-associated protein YgaU